MSFKLNILGTLCNNLATLEAQPQIVDKPLVYYYSGSEPALTLEYQQPTVEPEVCSIVYSCETLSGPKGFRDICLFNEDSG